MATYDKARGRAAWRYSRRKRWIVDLATTVVILVTCGVLLAANWRRVFPNRTEGRAVPIPTQPLSIAESRTLGSRTAPAAMIEWSDLQCPYCARFATETLPTLVREYVSSGRLLLAFRHFPIERLHPAALTAAKALECAARQGRFAEAHDWLFQQRGLYDDLETRLSSAIGLSAGQLTECVASDDVARRIRDDLTSARALGVVSTPTFFIGPVEADDRVKVTQILPGAASIGEFRKTIDSVLKHP